MGDVSDAPAPGVTVPSRAMLMAGGRAALAAAGGGLAVLVTLTAIGWITAPHVGVGGGLSGVLRSAGLLWLVAHHVEVTVHGVGRIGLLPLGLVLLPGALIERAGRWMTSTGHVTQLRHVGYAALAIALPYTLFTGAVAVASRTPAAAPSLWQAVCAGFLVALVASGFGARPRAVAQAGRAGGAPAALGDLGHGGGARGADRLRRAAGRGIAGGSPDRLPQGGGRPLPGGRRVRAAAAGRAQLPAQLRHLGDRLHARAGVLLRNRHRGLAVRVRAWPGSRVSRARRPADRDGPGVPGVARFLRAGGAVSGRRARRPDDRADRTDAVPGGGAAVGAADGDADRGGHRVRREVLRRPARRGPARGGGAGRRRGRAGRGPGGGGDRRAGRRGRQLAAAAPPYPPYPPPRRRRRRRPGAGVGAGGSPPGGRRRGRPPHLLRPLGGRPRPVRLAPVLAAPGGLLRRDTRPEVHR